MSAVSSLDCDVVVIGGGNAGFCAAVSAAQAHAGKVILIDKCPEDWAGGNSYFTAGAFRTVHAGLDDVLPLVSNVDEVTSKLIDLDPYSAGDFLNDMSRITQDKYDKELGKSLVEESNEAVKWLAKNGLDFELSFNRQAYKVDGRYKFFGGICLKTNDGGAGLVKFHQRTAKAHNVEVLYSTAAQRLHLDSNGSFVAVSADRSGKPLLINAKAVVLAAGGFESSPTMREQYLGPGWELAHVRGTPYNTGECLEIALRDIAAQKAGQWSGCHSVAWDANSPTSCGNREISNEFTKSGYPLGITINIKGHRFFDEGADLRNYTYAKFGRAILAQPQSVSFQIWDSKGIPWLRDEEYRDAIVEKIWGDTIDQLAEKCSEKGLENAEQFVETIRRYNEAVQAAGEHDRNMKWDPAIRDGLSTQSSRISLEIPKSNWALPIKEKPFMAVKVGCGVTFTFGGLAVDHKTSGVLSTMTGKPVPGVFCAGEMMGGLFYENYPGGSGLTSGAVFGRKAGISAANLCRSMTSIGKDRSS
ncbi:FAD/NAD(P)-binding domain-containing protein [Stipitochalara longipes BDJ]|nr:FAD/NAD(P)-binding domain-containing protein [Stipitochalara longipes BDJ]